MEYLYKKFIKNYRNVKDPKVIKKYGLLAGITGIVLNVLLFIIKIIISLISGSVSIISDAFNNLSDASSSIITIVGFKMASKPADKEHPFGHQRIEYVCAFIISVMILFIGVELGISSIKKIFNPSEVSFSYTMLIILFVTMLVKLWMAIFYKKTSSKIKSLSLKASAKDSLNDVVTTFIIVIGLLIGKLFDINLDGYLGLLVCLYVLIGGFFLIKETINNLIGGTPDENLIDKVTSEIKKEHRVLGLHDTLFHYYGLGQVYMSTHAEVDGKLSLIEAHDFIDILEKRVKKIYNVDLVIHIDPVLLNDALLQEINEKLRVIVRSISSKLSYHELKIINKNGKTNICFDLQVPYDFKFNNREIYSLINKQLRAIDDAYRASISFEKI